MKKLLTLCAVTALAICVSTIALADTLATDKTVTVHLPVDSQFGMTIWDTEFDQWIANVLPGGGGTVDLHIAVSSNHVAPWTILARSDGLVGENQTVPDTLPVVMTTYDGGAGLTGTVVTDVTLTGVDATVYSSGAGEAPVSGLEVSGILAITSLVTTKQDLYTGTVVLTLTE